MKFNNKKFDWKKRDDSQTQMNGESEMRKNAVKKDRREKYKVKNQKFHQLGGWESEDEYGGMF